MSLPRVCSDDLELASMLADLELATTRGSCPCGLPGCEQLRQGAGHGDSRPVFSLGDDDSSSAGSVGVVESQGQTFDYVYPAREDSLGERQQTPVTPRVLPPVGSITALALSPDLLPVSDYCGPSPAAFEDYETHDVDNLAAASGSAGSLESVIIHSEGGSLGDSAVVYSDLWVEPPVEVSAMTTDPVEHVVGDAPLNSVFSSGSATKPKRKWSLRVFKWPFAKEAVEKGDIPALEKEKPPLPRNLAPRQRPFSLFKPAIPAPDTLPTMSPISAANQIANQQPSWDIPHTPQVQKSRLKSIQINQYLMLRELGRGVHGTVRLAYDTLADRTVAIKIVGRRRRLGFSGANREPDVRREVAVLKKISGFERCVGLLEVLEDVEADETYLVLEYMPGGPVKWALDPASSAVSIPGTPDPSSSASGPRVAPGQKPYWDESSARPLLRDVLLGLAFLHSRAIIHRDIKPANLLVDTEGRARITDFGTSLWEGEGGVAVTEGTPAFWAPEMVGFGGSAMEAPPSPSEVPAQTLAVPKLALPKIVVTRALSDASAFSRNEMQLFPSNPSLPNGGPSRGSSRPQLPSVLESPNPAAQTTDKAEPAPSPAVDIWALGVTMYCLLFGRTPFAGTSEWTLFRRIREDDVDFPESIPVSIACRELLEGMMTKDVLDRWTIERIALWPWTTEGMEAEEREDWVGRILGFVAADMAGLEVEVAEEEVKKAVGVMGRLKRKISMGFGKVFGRSQSVPSTNPEDMPPPSQSQRNRNSFYNRLSLYGRPQSHTYIETQPEEQPLQLTKRFSLNKAVMRVISLPSVRKGSSEQQPVPRKASEAVASTNRMSYVGATRASTAPAVSNRFSYAGPAYQAAVVPKVVPYGHPPALAVHSYSSASLNLDDEEDEEVIEGGEWTSLWAGTALDDSVAAKLLDHEEHPLSNEDEGDSVEGSNTTLHVDVVGDSFRAKDEDELASMSEEQRLRDWDRGVVYYD